MLTGTQEGINSSIRYKELQTSYDEYAFRFQEVNSRESITSLQEWYKIPRVVIPIGIMTVNQIEAYVFPEVGEY